MSEEIKELDKIIEKEFLDAESLEETAEIDLSEINIDWKQTDYSVNDLLELVKTQDLYVPALQRNYVWKKEQREEFIESLLIGIPIPSIYLSKFEDNQAEKYNIIDGLQRITTLLKFINNQKYDDALSTKWKLKSKVSKWGGKTFSELDNIWKNKLKRTRISTIIINQKVNNREDAFGIFNIFARINKTGTKLSNQQIRSSLNYSENIKKLSHLADTATKANSIKITDSNKKNANQDELVLRGINLYKIMELDPSYNKISLKNQLNNTAEWLKQTKQPDVVLTMNKAVTAIDRYNSLVDSDEKVFYCPIVAKNKLNEVTFSDWTSPLIFETIMYLLIKNESIYRQNKQNRTTNLLT